MIVHRFLPMCDINRTFPAGPSKEDLRECVILDTFDMFSPAYDNPQRISRVKKWMQECGVEVTFAGFVTYGNNMKLAVVKGVKK